MSTTPSSDRGGPVRIIRGSAFIFACRLGGALLTFGSQVLLARLMGAAELGTYVLAFSWAILLGTLATLGFPPAAIRFVNAGLAESDHGSVLGFCRRGHLLVLGSAVAVSVFGAAALLLAGDALDAAYRLPMLLALATVPLLSLLSFYSSIANSFSWLLQSFLPGNVLRPLLFLGAIALVSLAGAPLDAAGALQIQWLAAVLITVATGLRLRQRLQQALPASVPAYNTRRWLRTALPLLGVSVFTGFLAEITVVLVGFYLPSDAVAIFQVSYRVALLIGFGLFAVDAFTAPEMARLVASADRDNLQHIVNRATRLRFWPALAAVIALALVGRQVLGLFGAEFVAGYTVLVILALAQLAQAAGGPVMRLLSVSGHEDLCLRASLGALVALVPLVAWLVPALGTTGAALATLLDVLLWSLWMRWLVVRHLGIRPALL